MSVLNMAFTYVIHIIGSDSVGAYKDKISQSHNAYINCKQIEK